MRRRSAIARPPIAVASVKPVASSASSVELARMVRLRRASSVKSARPRASRRRAGGRLRRAAQRLPRRPPDRAAAGRRRRPRRTRPAESSGGAGVSAPSCSGTTQASALGIAVMATPTTSSRSPPSRISSPGRSPVAAASGPSRATSPGPRGSRPAVGRGRSIVASTGSAETASRPGAPAPAATRTSRRGSPASATSGSAAASATASGDPVTLTCAPLVPRISVSNGSDMTSRRCSVTSRAHAAIATTSPVSAACSGRCRRSARIRRPATRNTVSPPAAARGLEQPRGRPRPRGRTRRRSRRRASAGHAAPRSPRAGRA